MREEITKPINVLPFLNPGRLVKVDPLTLFLLFSLLLTIAS